MFPPPRCASSSASSPGLLGLGLGLGLCQDPVPVWLSRYPQCSHCVSKVAPSLIKHLDTFRNLESWKKLELETRFGALTGKGFQPGVSESFWESALGRASEFVEWASVSDWISSQDTFFDLPPEIDDLRGQPRLLRTTQTFADSKIVLKHVFKTVLQKHDFKFHSLASSSISKTTSYLDLRLALNLEEEYRDSLEFLPSAVTPKLVRIKHRKSFEYKGFSVDFTKSWSGQTRSEAEQNQKMHKTFFELEIECLDPRKYFERPGSSYTSLVASLFLKMSDFIPLELNEYLWEPCK